MREIKFRVWDLEDKRFLDPIDCTQLVISPLSGRVTDGATTPNVEILQYTGLKDKNGVEIYEGDIMTVLNTSYGLLRYNGDFEVVYDEGTFIVGNLKLRAVTNQGEVIGNKYENPELLK